MKKTSYDLLKEVEKLGFGKDKALEQIDAALDDEFGYENRKELSEENLSDELYNDILTSFKCEKECIDEMRRGVRYEKF